eukprot:2450912-Pleurochrysis_carterae.AAC.1
MPNGSILTQTPGGGKFARHPARVRLLAPPTTVRRRRLRRSHFVPAVLDAFGSAPLLVARREGRRTTAYSNTQLPARLARSVT